MVHGRAIPIIGVQSIPKSMKATGLHSMEAAGLHSMEAAGLHSVDVNSQSSSISACSAQSIFFERQRGGLCRMHALNAYFGMPKYNELSFKKIMDDFDTQQAARYGTLAIKCADFDTTCSRGQNIITYALAQSGIFARFVALGSVARYIALAIESEAFFVYNAGHIWIVAKKNHRWWNIDSISGVSPIDPSILATNRTIGLIIPRANLSREFRMLVADLRAIIGDDPVSYLTLANKSKNILGDAEVYIGTIVALLEVQRGSRREFAKINALIANYECWEREFIGANCLRLDYTLGHIPSIIRQIYALDAFLDREISVHP